MVTIYFGFVNELNEALAVALETLPANIQEEIKAYKLPEDRAERTLGKLLLRLFLKEQQASQSLDTLKYNEWGKLHFPDGKPSFSLSYAYGLAICAFTKGNEQPGIDAAFLQQVNPADFCDYLSLGEQEMLKKSPTQAVTFATLWTRKEAVLKAAGYGIDIPFSALEVIENPVLLESKKWYLQEVHVSPAYVVHLATANPLKDLCVRQVDLPTLMLS